MKSDVLIQLAAFRSTAALFWSKRLHAVWAFAVVFAGQRLLPVGSWLGDKANEVLVSYEQSASKLGWMLLAALGAVFFVFVARTLAERKPCSVWNWVAGRARTNVAERAISKIASLTVALSGACAGFGVVGAEFGVLFLLWIYFIASCMYALALFADAPAH